MPPLVDGAEGLAVQLGDRGGRDARAPQDLGDVLDSPGGDARKVHLHHRLLDGALPPAVALDHLGREGRAPELRHVELDLAAGRRQAAPVVARAVGLPLVGAFVATGVRDLVGFRVQQRVEGVLDGLPYELPEVLL